jgi:hypothetical protein
MVTKDSVDQDIWEMQQRKAKMNAAIMDSKEKSEDWSSDKNDVLQTAVNRFFKSPTDAGNEGTYAQYISATFW